MHAMCKYTWENVLEDELERFLQLDLFAVAVVALRALRAVFEY